MRVVTLFFAAIVGFFSEAYGQVAARNKATRLEKQNHYYDASRVYQGLHASGDQEALLKAAMNLYFGNRKDEALPYFRKADSLSVIKGQDQIFAYFECLKSARLYNEADALMRTHSAGIGGHDFKLHDEKVSYYKKLQSFTAAKVTRLPFNTEYSEISPTVYNGWLYFISTVPAQGNKDVHHLNNQPFYNLYGVPQESDMKKMVRPAGDFGKAKKEIKYQSFHAPSLPQGLNQRYHDGPICVSPSGKHMFFNSNWSKLKRPKRKDAEINLLMYHSYDDGKGWTEPEWLPFNSFDYSNQHPFFDEQQQTLYFSSNRPGGRGGFDIWKSTLASGTWSDPVNLGPLVNTIRDDVFPSKSPDGTFFFSSNGWPGLGGLDIFMVLEPSREPVNLTAALNTEKDDFGLYFTTERLANMTSNRVGSVGDDDIYGVELDLSAIKEYMRPPDRLTTGLVKDAETGEILDEVKVTVKGYIKRDFKTANSKPLQDSVRYPEGDREKATISVRYELAGYQVKEITIPEWPDEQLVLDVSEMLVRKPEQELTDEERQIISQRQLRTVRGNVPGRPGGAGAGGRDAGDVSGGNAGGLAGGAGAGKGTGLVQVRILDDQKFIIYFDFDKFNIRKDAAEILAKVAYVLLEEYEAAEVLLTGHTDTRGSIAYNERLSKNRAESAKQWLIKKGVDPKRIRTAYKGEGQLAVWCKDPLWRERNIDSCLSEKEHQLNRRVEIEILNAR